MPLYLLLLTNKDTFSTVFQYYITSIIMYYLITCVLWTKYLCITILYKNSIQTYCNN